jgi:hypothetical protein
VSDANVVKLLQPGSFADPLTEVLRNGARALIWLAFLHTVRTERFQEILDLGGLLPLVARAA